MLAGMGPFLNAARRTVVPAALVLVIFAFAGCLQVNANDTVSGQLTLFAAKSVLTGPNKTVEQGFAEYRKKLPPLPKGTETVYDDGTNFGTQITYTNTPLSEFNGSISVVHNGNTYTFLIKIDPKALAGSVANGNVNDTIALIKLTTFEISMTMPGKITDHNGKLIGQNTVVWNFAVNTDKPGELKAVSQVDSSTAGGTGGSGGGSSLLLIIALVVIVLLAGAVAVLLFLRFKGGKAKATPPTTSPTPR